jgi:carbamoyl-phosphate synthase small subunit
MKGKLMFEDGTVLEGVSFGYEVASAGEIVFTTGMVGYPESLTDPSYKGQILVFTYPIIGNYGVPEEKFWESEKIQTKGVIVSEHIDTPSHFQSKRTLGQWLKDEKIPGLVIKDTRFIAQKLRDKGTMLGKIVFDQSDSIEFYDPSPDNLVAMVSTKKVINYGDGDKTVVLIDCGVKRNIIHSLVKRNVMVIRVPWNYNIFENGLEFDAVFISNGPGDPSHPDIVKNIVPMVERAFENKVPVMGVCLGNQIVALAAGGSTYKLKFGHRSQNQPCLLEGTQKCYLTTQNHGFAVDKLPENFQPWFKNLNDNTNEGIIDEENNIMSVQFHPEACPGPADTNWIFDYFIEKI